MMTGPPPLARSIPPLSLGDILGSALAQTEAQLVQAREDREARIAADAQLASAYELARQIAPLLDASPSEVFDALGRVPDNMLGMLCSPEGWTVLTGFVANLLGRSQINFKPTLH